MSYKLSHCIFYPNIITWFIAKGAGACCTFPFLFLVVWQECCRAYSEALPISQDQMYPTWYFILFTQNVMSLFRGRPKKGPNGWKDDYSQLFIPFPSGLKKKVWLLLLLSAQYNPSSFKFSALFLYFHKFESHLVVQTSDFGRGPCWRGLLQSRCLAEPVKSIVTEACFGNPSSYSGCLWANPVSTSCLMGFLFFFNIDLM